MKTKRRRDFYRAYGILAVMCLALVELGGAFSQGQTAKSRAPYLEWKAVPQASSYEVEVSKSPKFDKLKFKLKTDSTRLKWPERNPGTYYWRVRAVDEGGEKGDYSVIGKLTLVLAPKRESPIVIGSDVTAVLQPGNLKQEAQPTPTPPPAVETWTPHPKWSLDLYGFGTWGSTNDDQGSIPYRSMLTGSPALSVGYKLGTFITGIYAEYSVSNQITPVANVSNQNVSGFGYLTGVQLQYLWSKYFLAGQFLLFGQYQMSTPTTLAQASIYSGPLGAELVGGFKISPRFSLGLILKYIKWTQWNLGDLSGNKLGQFHYGVGVRFEIL